MRAKSEDMKQKSDGPVGASIFCSNNSRLSVKARRATDRKRSASTSPSVPEVPTVVPRRFRNSIFPESRPLYPLWSNAAIQKTLEPELQLE